MKINAQQLEDIITASATTILNIYKLNQTYNTQSSFLLVLLLFFWLGSCGCTRAALVLIVLGCHGRAIVVIVVHRTIIGGISCLCGGGSQRIIIA